MEDILSDQTLSLLTNQSFWINTAIVVGGTQIIYWVLRSLIAFISTRLGRFSEHHSSRFYNIAVEMLRTTSRLLLFIFSLLIAIKFIDLPATWRSAVDHGWFIALIFQFALWLDCGVRLWLRNMLRDPTHVRNPVTMVILGIMLRVFIWAIILLAILSNMGVNITALVASLGVGGIAVALAVQNILGDLFASLSIAIDKPFEVGDFVSTNNISGTVEKVGLKTTRIRALGGEQIVISNADLLKSTVSNFKRMETRRIVFNLRAHPDTPPALAAQVPPALKEIIGKRDKARFDRAHLSKFDQNFIEYEIVYTMLDASYDLFMDTQQAILLDAMRMLHELGISSAPRAQQLLLQEPAENAAPELPIEGRVRSPAALRSLPKGA